MKKVSNLTLTYLNVPKKMQKSEITFPPHHSVLSCQYKKKKIYAWLIYRFISNSGNDKKDP